MGHGHTVLIRFCYRKLAAIGFKVFDEAFLDAFTAQKSSDNIVISPYQVNVTAISYYTTGT